MTQSIYEKIPSNQSTPTRPTNLKSVRRKSMPILHEHHEAGSCIREIRAHQDTVLAIDFDAPFGTMVSSAMDDTVRVWDLNAGRCIGMLEGHTASVRTLQVEDTLLATGSVDATIRLWDLSKAHYDPYGSGFGGGDEDEDDGIAFAHPDDQPVDPPAGTMADCPLFTLQAHLDEVTTLHFRGDTLVSGSSDKTLRQWDLNKGRCVQTLDVMWAAAQASAGLGTTDGIWRNTSRGSNGSAHFVGAVQVFDAALACGTADGMVRLWDLRSGQVHRSLVGHTGPVTCLQFDDVHLVTGSMDRSIRVSFFFFSFPLVSCPPSQNISSLPCVSLTSCLRPPILRFGISARVSSTTPTRTTAPSRASCSTPAASPAPRARTWSRSTTRSRAGSGIAARASPLPRSSARHPLSSGLGYGMGISSRVGKMA